MNRLTKMGKCGGYTNLVYEAVAKLARRGIMAKFQSVI